MGNLKNIVEVAKHLRELVQLKRDIATDSFCCALCAQWLSAVLLKHNTHCVCCANTLRLGNLYPSLPSSYAVVAALDMYACTLKSVKQQMIEGMKTHSNQ